MSEERLHRRVAGYHDIRLDGITDLVLRAPGASVLDIGCNRGLVGFEFANNGAALVHGCDLYAEGIATARHMFADLRSIESRFEIVDLTKTDALNVFVAPSQYDIVAMLATYHKIKRQMSSDALSALMRSIAARTKKYFGWRGTSYQLNENKEEMQAIDGVFGPAGLRRVHTSYISKSLGVAAIWERQ